MNASTPVDKSSALWIEWLKFKNSEEGYGVGEAPWGIPTKFIAEFFPSPAAEPAILKLFERVVEYFEPISDEPIGLTGDIKLMIRYLKSQPVAIPRAPTPNKCLMEWKVIVGKSGLPSAFGPTLDQQRILAGQCDFMNTLNSSWDDKPYRVVTLGEVSGAASRVSSESPACTCELGMEERPTT